MLPWRAERHLGASLFPLQSTMTTETSSVPLEPSQIKFLLDMMMGCPMGHTAQYSYHHNVDASELYNHLQSHLEK